MAAGDEHKAAIVEAQREQFIEEAMRSSVPHVFHDSSAHRDAALRRLVRSRGMQAYGSYWLLVELLTSSPAHAYDVGDDVAWEMLAQDMSALEPMGVDECKAFVAELYALDLISREHFDELRRVSITRVLRDVRRYAEGTAKKKLGAWARHNNYAGGKG